jgi:hypothetical protein
MPPSYGFAGHEDPPIVVMKAIGVIGPKTVKLCMGDCMGHKFRTEKIRISIPWFVLHSCVTKFTYIELEAGGPQNCGARPGTPIAL